MELLPQAGSVPTQPPVSSLEAVEDLMELLFPAGSIPTSLFEKQMDILAVREQSATNGNGNGNGDEEVDEEAPAEQMEALRHFIQDGALYVNGEIYAQSHSGTSPVLALEAVGEALYNSNPNYLSTLVQQQHAGTVESRCPSGTCEILRGEGRKLTPTLPNGKGAGWRMNTKSHQRAYQKKYDWEMGRRAFKTSGPHRCFLLMIKSRDGHLFYIYYFYEGNLV